MPEIVEVPRVGQLAQIRNRRVVIIGVDEHAADDGGHVYRLVEAEPLDELATSSELLLWELEPEARILAKNSLPAVADEPPMDEAFFRALVRSARFSALAPHPSQLKTSLPSTAASALQLEEFQLYPVVQALATRRIGLLIADDVGIGKTIEAGLILTELIARRRVRRVLILCPAALKLQWRDELNQKFSLRFSVVDREETRKLRKELGADANPWRANSQIICSYHYLRQPDVLQEFLAAAEPEQGSARKQWDLIIVDEAHNLAPPAFGQESDLTEMLRLIAPKFEHKLFLTATPHNGYTRSFTGLLELLDPVRFAVESEISESRKAELGRVLIRRLKKHIIEEDEASERPHRFASRGIAEVPITFSPAERALNEAFEVFRTKLRAQIDALSFRERGRRAGKFALEILNKRLLSCPVAFADSWFRFKEGLAHDPADENDVNAAARALSADVDDDQELVARAAHAAHTVGAWLKPFEAKLQAEIDAIDRAIAGLGLKPEATGQLHPQHDARFDALTRRLIEQKVRDGNRWKDDERLIIFTEYKTTLDYVERRLRALYPGEGAIRVLYGGMDDRERNEIKKAFNNPKDPVRVLVATDAASEGLNLQETARYLHHFDIPWNPSRLDQRNGRLDRHGQARNVVIHHFASDDSGDMRFMQRILRKVEDIREDLGSLSELFDEAMERRFFGLEDETAIVTDLERTVEEEKERTSDIRSIDQPLGEGLAEEAAEFARQIDLTPETLKETLEVALKLSRATDPLSAKSPRTYTIARNIPPDWADVVEETIQRRDGAMKAITFTPETFMVEQSGRRVFRPSPDTELLHLGHPVMRQALNVLARARYAPTGAVQAASRWTVTTGPVEAGFQVELLVTVEELAFNELREPAHHWVRTRRLGIKAGVASELPHQAPDHQSESRLAENRQADARLLWDEMEDDVRSALGRWATELTNTLRHDLDLQRETELTDARKRYTDRKKEVELNLRANSINRLEREYDKVAKRIATYQRSLYAEFDELEALQRRQRELEQELINRQKHYQDHLAYLAELEERDLNIMIPQRFTLRGEAIMMPVAIEIRFPEGGTR